MSDNSSPSSSPSSPGSSRAGTGDSTGSLVKDGRAVLDLRTRPTRAAVGMAPKGFISYPTGTTKAPVALTLRLPGGDVRGTFFQMDIATNYAFAADADTSHAPKAFDLYQHEDTLAGVRTLLQANAGPLGLSAADITSVTSESTSILSTHVDDWLSTYVQVRARDDGSFNVIYSLAVDRFHNEATDRIIKNGVLGINLGSRPSREALGFLPSYDTATVEAEPNQTLRLRLVTPTGTAELPLVSAISDGTSTRADSTQFLVLASRADAVAALRSAGPALGFDVPAAVAFARDTSQDYAKQTFSCASTSVYTCSLRVGTSRVDGAEKQVQLNVNLTYR